MEPKDFTSLKSDFFNTLTLLISKDLCRGRALGKQMRKSCPDNDDDDDDDCDERFDPRAEMGTAHHMLLFGCKEPGQRETLFRFKTIMILKRKGGDADDDKN